MSKAKVYDGAKATLCKVKSIAPVEADALDRAIGEMRRLDSAARQECERLEGENRVIAGKLALQEAEVRALRLENEQLRQARMNLTHAKNRAEQEVASTHEKFNGAVDMSELKPDMLRKIAETTAEQCEYMAGEIGKLLAAIPRLNQWAWSISPIKPEVMLSILHLGFSEHGFLRALCGHYDVAPITLHNIEIVGPVRPVNMNLNGGDK